MCYKPVLVEALQKKSFVHVLRTDVTRRHVHPHPTIIGWYGATKWQYRALRYTIECSETRYYPEILG